MRTRVHTWAQVELAAARFLWLVWNKLHQATDTTVHTWAQVGLAAVRFLWLVWKTATAVMTGLIDICSSTPTADS